MLEKGSSLGPAPSNTFFTVSNDDCKHSNKNMSKSWEGLQEISRTSLGFKLVLKNWKRFKIKENINEDTLTVQYLENKTLCTNVKDKIKLLTKTD